MARQDVVPDDWVEDDPCYAGLGRRDRREKAELLSIEQAAALDGYRRQHGELPRHRTTRRRRVVCVLGFERGSLETRQCRSELIVRASIHPTIDGAEKRVEG